VELDRERARLNKRVEELQSEIVRSEQLLAKEGFASKAPADVVERVRVKLADYRDKQEKLKQRLDSLG
jgi:valyl-tRNA synthetase